MKNGTGNTRRLANRGDCIGIIGRNGAGKSTLLKILSRITCPTSGQVGIRGRVSSLLEVGTGFHPELTGRENIYLNGAILGLTRRDIATRFDQIVEFAGVDRFLDTPVKRYSSGMYVRLAFSVAAHLEPEVLVVDEVLAVGDAEFQKKCLGKMGDISREGRTILFVSHNIGAIADLCSKVILLEVGEIMKYGITEEVIKHYLKKNYSNGAQRNLLNVSRNNNMGKSVKMSQIYLLNSEGEKKNEFLFGEPFRIVIEIEAYESLDNCSVVVGINSFTGIRILTSMSDESIEKFQLLKGRKNVSELMIVDVLLKPSQYNISLGLVSNGKGLEHLEDILEFSVVDINYAGCLHSKFIKKGYLQMKTAKWKCDNNGA